MKAVGLIPARGGSKGIPKKNLIPLLDKPLIAWTCEAARGSQLAETFVSTDDSGIAETCRKWGVEAPFLRPLAISDDHAPMIEVLKHFLNWLRSEKKPCDAIVLLQPTSPLRTARHINESLDAFTKAGADSLVSVMEVAHHMHPFSVQKKTAEGFLENFMKEGASVLRRQDKPLLWARNGPAIVITTPALIDAGKIYGDRVAPYRMAREDSVDIDEMSDLLWAEFLLRKRP